MNNGIIYYQLLGMVGAGSFISEMYFSQNKKINPRRFISTFLAKGFKAYLIALIFLYTTKLYELSIIVGGLLAVQDKKMLENMSRRILLELLKTDDKGD